MGLGSPRLRLLGIGLWVDNGGVGSFAADAAGLVESIGVRLEGGMGMGGASGAGLTRALIFMLA